MNTGPNLVPFSFIPRKLIKVKSFDWLKVFSSLKSYALMVQNDFKVVTFNGTVNR